MSSRMEKSSKEEDEGIFIEGEKVVHISFVVTSGTSSGTHVCFLLVEQAVALLVATLLPQYRDTDGICSSHVSEETFWKSVHDDHDVTTVSIVALKLSKKSLSPFGQKIHF